MKRINKLLASVLLIIISLILSIGCSSLESKFSLEDFKNELQEKGYKYTVQEESFDNLLGPMCESIALDDNFIVDEKQYILYDTLLYVYSYENNKEMEKTASTVNKDASVISNSELPIEIDWYRDPHFYKKGTIIVRYEGSDEKIINDLKEIMGEQFAGK